MSKICLRNRNKKELFPSDIVKCDIKSDRRREGGREGGGVPTSGLLATRLQEGRYIKFRNESIQSMALAHCLLATLTYWSNRKEEARTHHLLASGFSFVQALLTDLQILLCLFVLWCCESVLVPSFSVPQSLVPLSLPSYFFCHLPQFLGRLGPY